MNYQSSESESSRSKSRIEAESDRKRLADYLYDASLEQNEREQPIEIGEVLDSGDKDIVDVLLEQWTVPVY
jgi:hypothetical protein